MGVHVPIRRAELSISGEDLAKPFGKILMWGGIMYWWYQRKDATDPKRDESIAAILEDMDLPKSQQEE